MSPKGFSFWAAVCGLLLVGVSASRAGDCPCPPPHVHCTEGPPCIIFKHVCPRPVCDPCNLEHWGYYPTCWRRWPGNWANCPHRSPPWVYNGPDGQLAEVAPNAPRSMMAPVAPTMSEPRPESEEIPMPRPSLPNYEEQGKQKYPGTSPVSSARPKLQLYTAPRGN